MHLDHSTAHYFVKRTLISLLWYCIKQAENLLLRRDEIRDILMLEMSHESAKLDTFLVIHSSTLAKTKEC